MQRGRGRMRHVAPAYSVSDPKPLMLDNSHKSELMFATRSLNSKGTRLLDDRQGLAPTES